MKQSTTFLKLEYDMELEFQKFEFIKSATNVDYFN